MFRASPVVCLGILGLVLAPGVAETESTATSTPDASYVGVVYEVLLEVNSLVDDEGAGIDEAWPLVESTIYSMAHLLTHEELEGVLAELENSRASSWDSLVLAAFWLQHGDDRVPRRFDRPEPSTTYQEIEVHAGHTDSTIRAAALAILAKVAPPTLDSDISDIDLAQIESLSLLTQIAPDSVTSDDIALHLLAECLAIDSDEVRYQSQSIGEIARANALADSLLSSSNESANTTLDTETLRAIMDSSANTTIRLRCAELLSFSLVPSEFANSEQSSFMGYAVTLAYLRANDPANAYAQLESVLSSEIPRDALATTLNTLGMALAREGLDVEATTTFNALADLYPGSQLATYAEEHITHLAGSSAALTN